MLIGRDHGLVRCPEIRVAGRCAPRFRHLLPECAAGRRAAVTQNTDHHWTRSAGPALPRPRQPGPCCPQTTRVRPTPALTAPPPLVDVRGWPAAADSGLFLSQPETVVRE